MEIQSAEFVRGIKGTNSILHSGLPQVAFVGRSNVGKSSVLNALFNRKDLVKVGKKPGKTLEINFFLVNQKFYFVDLPGYGYAKAGGKAKEKIKKLILWYLTGGEARPVIVVLITDIKAGFTDFDKEMLQILSEQGYSYVIVANKIDKLNQKEAAQKLFRMKIESNGTEVFPHSAKTKKGTDVLRKRLLHFDSLRSLSAGK
ncbi:MAG: ribosome biogenesis GTP-binding protein YihA/YsxC [bacterium]|nr:ribosome biogenesis GTP-binding protein YihA/YsxC [bacterium]